MLRNNPAGWKQSIGYHKKPTYLQCITPSLQIRETFQCYMLIKSLCTNAGLPVGSKQS